MSIKLTQSGVYYKNGAFVPEQDGPAAGLPVPPGSQVGHHGLRHSQSPQYL